MKYLVPALLILVACGQKEENKEVSIELPTYPKTETVDQRDTYFGKEILDPYRWLENDTAPEVEAWVKAQNEVTESYISQIPYRDKIQKRLEEIWNYPKYSAPFKKGDKYYFFKNDGLQNQSVMYVQEGLEGEPSVFLDPNTLSDDGTKALSGLSFSNDYKYLAYSVSSAGSDWKTMYLKNLETGELESDEINWIKFSGASWYKDGFFYAGYDQPKKGLEFSQSSEAPKIRYHKLGTPQSEDILIYENPGKPKQYNWPIVDEDEKHLMINISEGTHGNSILYRSLDESMYADFKVLYSDFEYNRDFVGTLDGELLFLTNDGAKNYQLVKVDPNKDNARDWEVLIEEKEEVLQGVSNVGSKLFASYLKNANSLILEYSEEGELLKEVELPGIGSVSGFGGEKEDTELFYTFTSFVSPPTIYHYDVESGNSKVFRESEFNVDLSDYETKQVWYPSKDGTKIPMFITHKKGIELNGKNPTLLYAYGGFNISITPSFSVSNIVFLEQGGVYAVANLRGGGEFGESWHEQGMLEKKQTVFDDFIAAAEYLISEKYTDSDHLAISGRSNGGLLVGACMTQRPDLYKVALPAVGVLDMLRYHKFTVGWGWAVEYGSSENETDFNYLIEYSPLHNVKDSTEYPATLVTTADHDDRVVPAHSFKFIAELQAHHANKVNPVLIRIEENAGHGAGKPTAKIIEEQTDIWSFVFWNLGIRM
ncbi:S9 family peptidase [bacterium]|nr:S9 family peptidase [bacterium]